VYEKKTQNKREEGKIVGEVSPQDSLQKWLSIKESLNDPEALPLCQ